MLRRVSARPQTSELDRMNMQHCRDVSIECHKICAETANYCLEAGGDLAQSAHVRVLLDCAQVCQTSADLLIRVSDLQVMTCQVCADVCERCASVCDAFPDDAQMQACADTCRACAATCRDMTRAEAA
jgi:hypothetical protein